MLHVSMNGTPPNALHAGLCHFNLRPRTLACDEDSLVQYFEPDDKEYALRPDDLIEACVRR